jgi:hypothetical protein
MEMPIYFESIFHTSYICIKKLSQEYFFRYHLLFITATKQKQTHVSIDSYGKMPDQSVEWIKYH